MHLLVAGRDPSCQDVDRMVRVCPHVQVHRFPGSGHSIHSEDPDGFLAVLVAVADGASDALPLLLTDPQF